MGTNTLPCFLEINNSIIYSYEKHYTDSVSYGIKKINMKTLESSNLYENIESTSNSSLDTLLKSNTKEFIYFTEENNNGVFLIGNEKGIINRIPLEGNQKVDNYGLVENGIVFSFSINDNLDGGYRELIYKDLKGNTISSQKSKLNPRYSYYRLTTNNKDCLLSVDNAWNTYVISIADDSLYVEEINLPSQLSDLSGSPFIIFNINENNFLLYYFIEQRLLLLELE